MGCESSLQGKRGENSSFCHRGRAVAGGVLNCSHCARREEGPVNADSNTPWPVFDLIPDPLFQNPINARVQPALHHDSPHASAPPPGSARLARPLRRDMLGLTSDDATMLIRARIRSVRQMETVSPGCGRHPSHPSCAHYPNLSRTAVGL